MQSHVNCREHHGIGERHLDAVIASFKVALCYEV